MENDIQEVLISEEQIRNRVKELGAALSKEYAGKNPLFVGVLKGVVIFFSDIVRQVTVPCEFDFMWISSYQNTTSTGNMIVKRDVSAEVKGRHVVILEDVFDTGNSLDFTYRHLLSKEPASIAICTFLDKPARRDPKVRLQPEYTGFVIPNKFVVGYGMDYNERYRNLPYIGILKPEVYEK